MIDKKQLVKNMKYLVKFLESTIKKTKLRKKNLEKSIRKAVAIDRKHHLAKLKIIMYQQKAKGKESRARIQKHFDAVHRSHEEHKKVISHFKKLLRNYHTHLAKFEHVRWRLSHSLKSIMKNNVNKGELSRLDRYTKKIIKKIKK